MTLMTFVRDPGENAFAAVVVDNGKLSYVWPTEGLAPAKPAKVSGKTDEELIANAASSLGPQADPPFDDFTTVKEATDFARQYLDTAPEPANPLTQNADDAFSQISLDYPGFDDLLNESGESDEIDPNALDNYVMLLMGPIDPEGENGWVFRAVDGQPREGDEDMYLHLPTADDGSAE